MPNRINHVKAVTPHPEIVNAFLTQVCDIPDGWPLGGDAAPVPLDQPLGAGGEVSQEEFHRRRTGGATADSGTPRGGFIAGDSNSRQFQIFGAEQAGFWAVCISTRDIESVYERCQQRQIPCTPVTVADWNKHDNIRNFFCVVDGLFFEVIRVEPKEG